MSNTSQEENSDQTATTTRKETYEAPELLKHEGITELTDRATGSREIPICPTRKDR
jgi:hypothetical protein